MVKNKKEVNEDFVYTTYTLISLFSYTYTHTAGLKSEKKCNLEKIFLVFFFSFLSHCDDSHRAQIRDEVEDDDNNSSIFMIKKIIFLAKYHLHL